MKQLLVVLVFLALTVVACQAGPPMAAITGGLVSNETANMTSNTTPIELSLQPYTLTKTEGDLIALHPVAVDLDGGPITYTFSQPFDKNGQWQTGYGDAGNYTVTVTATTTPGLSTSEEILVIVQHADRPPVLACPPTVTVKEGETATIDCVATDPQNASITLTYDGWMTARAYETTYGDAGTHTVTVTANNGLAKPVHEDITVIVQKVNRPPVFAADFSTTLVGQEDDVLVIDTSGVTDPDGNKLTFTFSTPFDNKGVWKTTVGNAGQYSVDVVASNGVTTAKRTVTVIVNMKHTAPVLKLIPDITVTEGDTITLPLQATSRENNTLTYTVSGWMTSSTYTTTYGDAGTYTDKVTVSDGELSDSQVVHITVLHKNRPPVFKVPA
jgi:predicted secreted protein